MRTSLWRSIIFPLLEADRRIPPLQSRIWTRHDHEPRPALPDRESADISESTASSDQILASSSLSSSTTSSSLLPAEETASSGTAAQLDLTGKESG